MTKNFLQIFLTLNIVAAHATEDAVLVSRIVSIYDADTFTVDIDPWPDIIGKRIGVRVLGVDAPELKGRCAAEVTRARAAKQFTVERLRTAKRVELRGLRRDKYFRIDAHVYADGVSLAELLIHARHARPYDGGARQAWCP